MPGEDLALRLLADIERFERGQVSLDVLRARLAAAAPSLQNASAAQEIAMALDDTAANRDTPSLVVRFVERIRTLLEPADEAGPSTAL